MRASQNPRLYWRYLLTVLREFRTPVIVFLAIVLGGGWLVHARGYAEDFVRGCYAVFALTFFENTLDRFPSEWYLRLLWFATPIVGIVMIAEGIASFGVMLLNRTNQLREWNVVVASSYSGHIIICGLGKVGFCILKELMRIGSTAVAIEKHAEVPFIRDAQDLGIPVIVGDAKQVGSLREANLATASAVIAATDDDLANLEIALTVREVNPEAQVVVRMFNPDLARKITTFFKIPTISSSHTSAPAFAAAATHRSIHHSFSLDGIALHFADLEVRIGSRICGCSVRAVQEQVDVTLVLHKRGDAVDVHPRADIVLEPGDKIVIMADEPTIRRMEEFTGMRK